jgi:hypothetical protein
VLEHDELIAGQAEEHDDHDQQRRLPPPAVWVAIEKSYHGIDLPNELPGVTQRAALFIELLIRF